MPKTPASAEQQRIDHLHHQAFENSLQANIIFTVANGRIISANSAACKLLGYAKKELLTKYRKDIFNISENNYKKMIRQRNVDGSAKANLSLVKKRGKLVPCEITSVIFKNDNGIRSSILSIVDLRERLLLQKNIDLEKGKHNNDWIRSITRASYDVIWDWDIGTGMIAFGNNYEKIFGYRLPGNKIGFKEWLKLLLPEERDNVEMKMNRIFESQNGNWEDHYRFTCADGSMGEVTSRANVIRDSEGNPIRVIGVIHDQSKLKKLEEIHEEEIRMKELETIGAIVEAKEMERSDIGKELHDNINQLLGASMLYLNMARNDLKNGEIYLIHSSEYTLTAIEEIRKLTKGLATVTVTDFGLCVAIERLCQDVMEASPIKIQLMLDHELENTMSEKFKLNTFRILQEQLNNIIKHAKASAVQITLSKTVSGLLLSIADDGIGFDSTQKAKGLGIGNIISRTELYKGNANFISEPGKGCILTVSFPAG